MMITIVVDEQAIVRDALECLDVAEDRFVKHGGPRPRVFFEQKFRELVRQNLETYFSLRGGE